MSNLYPTVESPTEMNQTVPAKYVAPEGGKHPEYTTQPGPQEQRKCQDVFFLILFALFWVGMAVIAGLAISQGNLNRLRYGNDTDGNLCGVPNAGNRDLTSAPYQYRFNPTSYSSYIKCVSQCPNATYQPICPYDVQTPTILANATAQSSYALVVAYQTGKLNNCTLTYKSQPVLNRCVPDLAEMYKLLNVTGGGNSSSSVVSDGFSIGTEIFSNVYDSWQTILICSFIALALSFVWMLFMQYFSGVVVWFTVIMVNVISIAFTAVIWSYWSQVRLADEQLNGYGSVASSSANVKVLLAIAIVFSVVTGIILLLTITLRKRIQLAVAVIGEASKAIRKMPLVTIFPIFKYALLALLVAWTLYIWACLVTSGGTVSNKIKDQIADNTRYDFTPNEAFQYLTIYYALGFFWTFQMIVAINQTTVAGAIASWYWARDKSAVPHSAVTASFMRTIRYHLGSLAFGSLIIAIVETIRAIILYLERQMKAQKNRAAECCLACVQCCLGCVESVLKFITKNAYIEIAIYGYPFCQASRTAVTLLMRNAVRIFVVDRVADFMFFLGKLMITLAVAIIGASMLKNPSSTGESVGRFWGVSLLIIMVMAYAIACCFMAVYDMAIATIFLCFCEDSERNDGSAAKPYYMEESLRKFVSDAHKEAPKV